MTKDVFQELSKSELIDAVTYFPGLSHHKKMKPNLDTDDFALIKHKQSKFNALPANEKVIELINKYFELERYGKLDQLSEIEWAVQLITRKKILGMLSQSSDSGFTGRVQAAIFEMFQNPVVDINKSGALLSTKNVNDLTVFELSLMIKTYQNNEYFDFIDNNPNLIGPNTYGNVSNEEYDFFNSLNDPIQTPNIADNKFKVLATVDLSVSDSQLKTEFAEFLKRKRNELELKPIVDEFKNKDKVSLIKHNVLQYLDLLVLTKYVHPFKKLTNAKYATFLFPPTHPDYDKANGKFNDSTLKYASQTLSGDTIQRLLSSINKKQAIAISFGNPSKI
jgi:hypothetical protein